MNKSRLRKILVSEWSPIFGLVCIIAIMGILAGLFPDTACAQAVPSRTYQLQEYRPIAPAPPSNADRVRLDVIKATNPYTGTVDVRMLRGPQPLDVPSSLSGPGIQANVGMVTGKQPLDVPGSLHGPGVPANVRPVRGNQGLDVPSSLSSSEGNSGSIPDCYRPMQKSK